MAVRSLEEKVPKEMSYPGMLSIGITGALLALSIFCVASGTGVWAFSIVSLYAAFSAPRRYAANRAAFCAPPFPLRLRDAVHGAKEVPGGVGVIVAGAIWPITRILTIDLPSVLGWLQWIGSIGGPIAIAYMVYRGGMEVVAAHQNWAEDEAHITSRMVPLISNTFGVLASVIEKEAKIRVVDNEVRVSGHSGFVPPALLAKATDRVTINRNLAAQGENLMLSPDSDNRLLRLVPMDMQAAAEIESLNASGGLLGAEIIEDTYDAAPLILADGSASAGAMDLDGEEF